MNKLYHILKVPLVLLLIFLSYNLLINGKKIQKINSYNAYQRDASKGIFNSNEWRCKLVTIVKNKIEKTDFQAVSKDIIDEIIKYYKNNSLETKKDLYNPNSSIMDNLENIARKSYNKVVTTGVDFLLKKGRNFITKKIGKNNKELQKLVSKKSTDFLLNSIKVNGEGKSFNTNCKPKIVVLKSSKKLEKKQNNLFYQWWTLFLGIILTIFFLYYKYSNIRKWILIDTSIITIILLVLGIMLPMMQIDATLLDLKINLLDQPILFTDQSLYFRSKSIYDIVTILLPVNPIIGIAVMVFSVVLPTIKIVSTFILIFSKKHRIYLEWIITHLGKWSMADVFLIAIFLANLSFQNILTEQLKPMANNKTADIAINTSHSNIEIGFYFFFGYVILSMIIAKLTIKFLKQEE